ncbi:DNA phosphorothioation-associated putative methyltransferase [Oscillatoria sp. CS-180]|uniref:DNA phosphorothioation-associated putative methyltransferase n=1 Tax=Oscillatoria sp. CS-180 TaxID=3021720 RepID=UPI00232A8145|nr:DNA phosphorothioation-associated putative methyltransferase [Oscillatoria sp. CS-180]MDB9527863.1 DNA phosphorothioation-associated putative methyltransferase [Oscillatoria sp. CS-180]
MARVSTQTQSYVELCKRSAVGKLLPDALYVHVSALGTLHSELQILEQQARTATPQAQNATLVKFSFNKPQIVYLFYPDFDADAHPALQSSIQVNLKTLEAGERDYSTTDNPPVLHRKETFVTPDYPYYDTFTWLTMQEEVLGLLEDSRGIGFCNAWEQRLRDRTLVIHDHYLACPIQTGTKPTQAKPKIQRHKAAIARVTASKPVRLAVEAGLFPSNTTYFDYGCGHGADIEYIKRLGLTSVGWDPYYRPDEDHLSADVVNLSYVINVIEDTAERREALLNAWNLAQKVLIVAAQVLIDDRTRGVIAYGDGIITSRNTFQKYYEQEELKSYIDQVLGVDSIPVALGIYFVFRDEAQAEVFRASRFRSRTTAPRIRLKVNKFEECRELLQPLMDFYTDRGRLPAVEELDQDALRPLQAEFGSIKRAFKVILKATDAGEWDAISDKRRNDLMVYLALSHFGKRPKFKDLSPTIRTDIKALFGSYQQACTAADLMLMSLGRTELLEERCRQSAIGQQRPNSLWVHVSAIDQLDPLLRLYEGCASRTIGRPEEATVVKFHVQKPQITYLFYPGFDKEPHPALHTSMAISLRDLHVRYRDYEQDNPPLVHQKDQLVTEDYPGHAKFTKLSQQERKWGLLKDVKAIFDRRGWERCLTEHGAELRGHRVVRRRDADKP